MLRPVYPEDTCIRGGHPIITYVIERQQCGHPNQRVGPEQQQTSVRHFTGGTDTRSDFYSLTLAAKHFAFPYATLYPRYLKLAMSLCRYYYWVGVGGEGG